MQLCDVSYEAHGGGATIYVTGLLGDVAALQLEEVVRGLPASARTVRVDLRAVEFIDPSSFVGVARALRRWADSGRGRVSIAFPARSAPARRRRLQLVDHRSFVNTTVSNATSVMLEA